MKKIIKNTALSFTDIFIGQKVKDIDGDIGIIIEIGDIYNIIVAFDGIKGQGIYCFHKCCNDVLFEVK